MIKRTRLILATAIITSIFAAPLLADDPDPAPPSTPTKAPLPTLDELLGIDELNSDSSPSSTQKTDLDRVLSPAQAGKAFDQAVGIMEQVANRLTDHNDLSLETQRLQQDILTMLDQVIESASKGNSKGGSSSAKSESAKQEQPDQQSQQSDSKGKPGDSPSNQSGEAMPGAGAEAQPNAQTAPDGVTWGALPQRIRDALSQGIADRYSELYRKATEEYYKSLAEDQQ